MNSQNESGYKCVYPVYVNTVGKTSYQYRFTLNGTRHISNGFDSPKKAYKAYLEAYKKLIDEALKVR